MKIAKILSFMGIMAMTAVLIYGFTKGDFFEDGGELMKNPWGIVSLVDLYVGFTLFSIWMALREKNIPVLILWIAAVMILGFFAASVYVFINLMTSRGDILRFFLGDRKEEILLKERSGERGADHERKR
ncbi:DUF1475 family protein [Proteiniclasticum sp.]|uniref:DUF1475 family protein n=1 Tax=Proteiniclasticum sp. TaxID=2053595 RepID=UPI0028A0EF51|nr:DUF1475 family protein [Proteiniclasticum sp.]